MVSSNFTDGTTDAETGDEGLSEDEKRKKHLFALKAMLERGLISRAEYDEALKQTKSGEPSS